MFILLLDYTDGCTKTGCNVEYSGNRSYWTSTPVNEDSSRTWHIFNTGALHRSLVNYYNAGSDGNYGVRPVITVQKIELAKEPEKIESYKVYENGTVIYYNPETNKVCNGVESNSTTGTKTGCMKWYTFNDVENTHQQ